MTCIVKNMADAAAEWRAFEEHSRGHIFSTYEWVSSWAGSYGIPDKQIKVCIVKKDGRTAALMPLWAPFFRKRFAGHRLNDINGPLWDDSLTDYAGALRCALAAAGFGYFELRHVLAGPEEQRFLPRGRETASIPTIHRANDFEAYYGGLSKKLRSNLGNAERRMEKDFGGFTTEHSFGDVDDNIALFAAIHAHKKDRGMRDLFADRRFYDFVSALGRRMAERRLMKTLILRAGGDIAAYKLSFIYDNNMYFWNTAFHPDFSRYRCGELMYREEIRYAFDNGLNCIFMGRGTGYNKTVWTSQTTLLKNHSFLGKTGGKGRRTCL